jgi:hypothetical protein
MILLRMFYAKSNVSQKLDVYSALLQRAIDEGDNSSYRTFFVNAFKEAHDLANDSKSFLDVDKSIYDVVYILFRTNGSYFKSLDNIDDRGVQDRVFEDVKKIFGTLRESNTLVLNG